MEERVRGRKQNFTGASVKPSSFAFATWFYATCVKVKKTLEANSPKLKAENIQ